MPEAMLVDALRTPLVPWEHASLGQDPVAMAAAPVQGLLDRVGLSPALLHELILGGTGGPSADLLPRQVALQADLPWLLPARAVRRGDLGGLAALQAGTEAICAGVAEVIMVAAVGHPALGGPPAGSRHAELADGVRWRQGLVDPVEAASWQARRYGITEEDLLALVARHGELAAGAPGVEELVPCPGADGAWLLDDVAPDAATGLSCAPAAGASAVLLASSDRPDGPELPVRARIVGVRSGAGDLAGAFGGGVVALRRLLAELVMRVEELDLFVLDAPHVAVWEAARRDLGISEEQAVPHRGHLVRGRLVGAPGLGAIPSLLAELEHRELRYGAVLVDSQDGQGLAVIIDREHYF